MSSKTQQEPILSVEDLTVSFEGSRGVVRILEGIDFTLYPGEVLALVGETGCGKSVTAKSLLDLIPQLSRHRTGCVSFEGTDLLKLSNRELIRVRGRSIAMIFQNPQSSINPVFTLGEQIFRLIRMYLQDEIDQICKQQNLKKKTAIGLIAKEKLAEVGLTETDRLLKSYAHEISGGMAQRYKIALALLSSPEILIADEATSALDVTVQAHILKLLKKMSQKKGTAILFITHDLGIAAQICDRVAVMYSGRIVEIGNTMDIFQEPLHPYTQGLLDAVPRLGEKDPLRFISGMIPDLSNPPQGCRFHPRCDHRMAICRTEKPRYKNNTGDHSVACHLYNAKAAG
ncbi:MAG: ABC transporter ATP-binding protein [Deltaproteobacteria bacterium]|nr:ABC transporter ATP-binding protein [Deltaproteobacteria bacterium]